MPDKKSEKISLPAEWQLSEKLSESKKHPTLDDLGWTLEEAAGLRILFGSIAEDWDDPDMDIYNQHYS